VAAVVKPEDFDKKYKIGPKEFKIFKDEFLYWAFDVYGLKGWEFIFQLEKDSENRASILRELESRIVIVSVADEWSGLPPDEFNLKRVAYHEACELLLSKLVDLCLERSVTEKQIVEEVHNLIRIFENYHFDRSYNKKKK
jgi:hypothetical protein